MNHSPYFSFVFRHSFWVALLGLLLFSCQSTPEPTNEELTQVIQQLNRQMEKAYNDGALDQVAAFYSDEAYLLGPNGYQQQGRAAIDDYWLRIKHPIRWKLDVIKVSKNESDLYETEYWKGLKNKPPHWNGTGLALAPNQRVIYQLGHSQLEYEREDATHSISHVDFIIVWQQQLDGQYQIVVDTYY